MSLPMPRIKDLDVVNRHTMDTGTYCVSTGLLLEYHLLKNLMWAFQVICLSLCRWIKVHGFIYSLLNSIVRMLEDHFRDVLALCSSYL